MISSREIIAILEADGWVRVNSEGSHFQYTHPAKPGKVTVPHPKKDFPMGMIKSMERQSGLKFRK